MKTVLLYLAAATCEIAGCFAFWAWLRQDRSAVWVLPGILALALFAYLLTLSQAEFAGRAFAAYGGIYILASMAWMRFVEKAQLDHWDLTGTLICLLGAGVILLGPR